MKNVSFGGRLYLIILTLLLRQYEIASQLISNCSNDTPFNKEEKFIIQLVNTIIYNLCLNSIVLSLTGPLRMIKCRGP